MRSPGARSIAVCLSLVAFASDPGRAEPRPCRGGSSDTRPNVVVFLSDDQAADTLGCQGNTRIHTPAIDGLAARGVRFTNAFVTTSLCSPSRASFLTGRYARSHEIFDNRVPLEEDVPTFASLLTAAGYDSAYVGKWHMGETSERPGFGFSASYEGRGAYNGTVFQVGGEELVEQRPEGWVDDVSTDYALEFLRRERDAPFLLVVGFKGPHVPQKPPERHAELYADLEWQPPGNADAFPPFPMEHEFGRLAKRAGVRALDFVPPEDWRDGWARDRREEAAGKARAMVERVRDYYRVLSGIDDNVGRVLDALDELGEADSTLVVYASDNGLGLGEHGLFGKRSAYEESMRIPLLVRAPRAPEAPQAARVVDELVLNVDLAPTILAYAGIEVPGAMHGRSLRPLIEGGQVEWREDFLYEYFFTGGLRTPSYMPTTLALRTRRAKLVRYPGLPSWTELFDLERDPLERRNLAADDGSAELLATLSARLDELTAALGPAPLDHR